MRKDLRYGMGIGALLLAFIVTFLVVRKHTENQHAQTAAAGDDSSSSDDAVEGGSAEANPTGVVAAGDTPVPNAAAALPPLKPVSTATPTAGTRTPPAAPDDPFAARPTGRQAAGRRPNASPAAPATPKADPSQDWDLILSKGWPAGAPDNPAPVRQPTPSPSTFRPGTVVPPTAVPQPHQAVARGRVANESAQLGPARLVGSMTSTAGRDVTANEPGTAGRLRGGDGLHADGSAVAAKTGRPYTVQEGDTFVSIAKAAFGNGKYFLQLERANPAVNPSRLKVGQQIVLPDLTVEARATRGGPFDHETDNRPINARTEYRVDAGDSLHRIAVKLYGTPRMVKAIYDANQTAIGPDPERLRFGMILKLPQSLASN